MLGEDIGHFGGAFGVTEGPVRRVRRRSRDRHADRRGGLRRRRGRRRLDGRAAGRRAAVRRLRLVRVRPDRHARGQDALALGHPAAARDPPARRAAAFAAARSTHPRPRAGSAGRPASRSSPPAASPTPTGCCAARSRMTIRSCTSSTRRSTGACATRRPPTTIACPIGSARVARSGSDATIVTYGSGVDLAAARRRDARGRGLARGRRPAHAVAARPRHGARVGRAHLAPARAAGGRALDRRRERRAGPRRRPRGSSSSTPRP